jgi:ribosome-binding protein aMBF1 (putative translation factor)
MVPDLVLGKRLEQFLKINIFGPSFDSSKSEEVLKKPSKLTLGDVVVIHGRVEEEVERGQ